MEFETAYSKLILAAQVLLEQNLNKPTDLDFIASEVGISKYHFHRIFKAETGITPKQYKTRILLLKAAQLLKANQSNLAEIALTLGFQNQETFSRFFKQGFGVSPSEYKSAEGLEAFAFDRYPIKSIAPYQNPITVIEKPPISYLYKRHSGTYDGICNTWLKLKISAFFDGKKQVGVNTFGIVHDDPKLTDAEECRYDACICFDELPMRKFFDCAIAEIPRGKWLVFRYKGAYETFYDVYDYLVYYVIKEQKLLLDERPLLEFYVVGPPFNRPSEFVTDFYIPVQ